MADSKLSQQLIVYAQLFIGMALFGTGTPSAKVVADTFPMFLGPFLRLLAASLALTPLLVAHRRSLTKISKSDWIEIIIIGGVGIVAFTIFLLAGMQRVNGVVGSVVMSLSPAAMAVAAVLFMRDRMGWRKLLAVTLAVGGVLIINVSGKSIQSSGWELLLGSILVFGAVASQTLYSLLGKRVMQDLRPSVVLPLISWIATLIFAGPGLYQAAYFDFDTPNINEWIGLLVWGMGPLAIGTLVWFHGLRQVRPSTASGYMSAMPAAALTLSYIWLGDKFHPIHLIGFALVFVSIGLVTWAHWINEKGQKDGESAAQSRSGAMPC